MCACPERVAQWEVTTDMWSYGSFMELYLGPLFNFHDLKVSVSFFPDSVTERLKMLFISLAPTREIIFSTNNGKCCNERHRDFTPSQ